MAVWTIHSLIIISKEKSQSLLCSFHLYVHFCRLAFLCFLYKSKIAWVDISPKLQLTNCGDNWVWNSIPCGVIYGLWPGVGILARKKWLTLNFHALLGYHYYFLSVTWSWFYVSGMSESQNITPTGLCHGPPRPLATFGIMHMFHAHIISVPSALPMSIFFFCTNPYPVR